MLNIIVRPEKYFTFGDGFSSYGLFQSFKFRPL